MQTIATKIFIGASLTFGVLGLLMVMTMPDQDNHSSNFHIIVMKLIMATVFVILSSFALSVAGKYLGPKK